MTAIWKHVVALTAFVALLWAAPTVARAGQNDRPAGMTVGLSRNGSPMTARSMVLFAGSKPKGADLTAANIGTFKQEDVEDRRRAAAVLLDERRDGTADVLIVLNGVAAPPPAPGSTRRDLGQVTIGRGVRLEIDAGAGTVTDATQQPAPAAQPTTTAAAQPPGAKVTREEHASLMRKLQPYLELSVGGNATVSSESFCGFNEAALGRINATLAGCGNNATSGAFGASAGLSVARLSGWNLVGAGGYGSLGRTRPEVDGTAQTFTVARRAQEKFRGGWVGGGFQRGWSSWRFQSMVGAAFLRRDVSNTDRFTRLSDGLVSEGTINESDTDVQPMVSVELYRRLGGPFWLGTGYRFTQFADDLKTQRLHAIHAGIQIAFGS